MIPKRGEFGWERDDDGVDDTEQKRAVACVNACSGCDPEKLGELIKAVRAVLLEEPPKGEAWTKFNDLFGAINRFTKRTE